MAASRKWLFKNKLRARAFGWRGSKLAISRLKEAASWSDPLKVVQIC